MVITQFKPPATLWWTFPEKPTTTLALDAFLLKEGEVGAPGDAEVVLVWENYTPGYQLPPTPTPPKLLKNRQILTWGWRNTVAGTFPWWPHPPESSHCNVHNNKLKTDQNPFFICVPTLVCSLLELLVSQTFHHSKNLPRYPPIMFNFPAKFCLNTQNY